MNGTTVVEPVKKKSGCRTGCMIILVIMLISVAAFCYIVNRSINMVVESMTTTTPVAVTVVPVNPIMEQSAAAKYQIVRDGIEHSKAVDVRFSANEINTLIASHPDFALFKGKFYVEMANDTADASFNFPLGLITEAMPGLKWFGFDVTGRHINGRAAGSFSMQGDEALVKISKLNFNGSQVPAEVIKELNSGLSKKRVLDTKNPKADEFFQHVDIIAIQNGELVVKTK